MIIIESSDNIEKKIRELSKNNIYIVGAGRFGVELGDYFNRNNIKWEGFYDKTPKSELICGKHVKKYDNINRNSEALYFISSFGLKDILIGEIKKRGILDKQIVCFSDHDSIIDLIMNDDSYSTCLSEISQYRNIHDGEKCFIIGNGPSLRLDDLEKIRGEKSFGANSIYAVYEHTTWRPQYYFSTDPIVCKEYASDKNLTHKILDNSTVWFTSIMGELFSNRSEYEQMNLRFVLLKEKYSEDGLPFFSEDCRKQMYIGGTVTYYCIQMAVYMGFKTFYLLGVDCNYSVDEQENGSVVVSEGNNYQPLIEEEEKRYTNRTIEYYGYPSMSSTYRHINAYKSAKKYCDEHGVRIMNATRGGKLEVFERVDFDSIL